MIIRITPLPNDCALLNLSPEATDDFTIEEVEHLTGFDFPMCVPPEHNVDQVTHQLTGGIAKTGVERAETAYAEAIKNAVVQLTTYDQDNTRELDAKTAKAKVR